MTQKKQSIVELLKQALAARKGAAATARHKPRPDMGAGARANKDAERLAGKSRKVH